MFGFKRDVIGESSRGFLFKNKQFEALLKPGVYRRFDPLGRTHIEQVDLTTPEFKSDLVDFIVQNHPQVLKENFQFVELGDNEVGICYFDGTLARVLPPATRTLFWKEPKQIEVRVIDISDSYEVSEEFLSLFGHSRRLYADPTTSEAILYYQVPDNHSGLLTVNGKVERTLEAGSYAFWKHNRDIQITLLDLRLQTSEISGQEILSKDKVSLRLNLTASYRITDPNKMAQELSDATDYLYKELQFGLREVVGTRTLDELLENKGVVNDGVLEYIRSRVEQYGIDVQSVGVKDIILPGEMKTILNQVVEAEKAAQANLVKRREETAATRSLHNTAKMMENNPTLLRLKELEVLEKVTESIDSMTVFGGLDGVLRDLVKMKGA